MILRTLHVAGFGRLVDRRFAFKPGLNVIFGSNESGKSTLANAIIASLYGAERKKETWRPWSGGPFVTTLMYELAGGEQIEVQRDFDRDGKGVRVYDRNGNDLGAKLGGHRLVPGEAHLGVPLDVFLNAACMKQQAMAIDEGKDAGPIAAHLARALDGGPREDAALGAIARLDDALRLHVGTERARKNAPLRALRAQADAQRAKIADERARLDALDDMRDRLESTAHERDRLSESAAELERRLRSLRAGAIATQLADLHDFRAELSALQADRARYDDVADFAGERERAVNDAYGAWQEAQRTAAAAQTEADATRMTEAERHELDRRRRDAGTIDDVAFAALSTANNRASAAKLQASAAGREAAAARVDDAGAGMRRAFLVATEFIVCVAIGFAIAHNWTWTGVAAALAAGLFASAVARQRDRARRTGYARQKQRQADEALDAEHAAATIVNAVIDPLGMQSFEELVAGRIRFAALLTRKQRAAETLERARVARLAMEDAATRFDELGDGVVPDVGGDRAARIAAVRTRAARKRERDGIAAHIHALELRRSTILGTDDEYGLEAELAELHAGHVDASIDTAPGARRALEGERALVVDRLRIARETYSRLTGELNGALAALADLAALDEELARTLAEIERIATFERAVLLAKTTLERRTQEAHQAFARRLEDYAAQTLGTITAGRYAEIFVDPTTLTIRVRVPETQAIVDLAAVSAGTRDQTYLVVRFAMARMFAEGFEIPPLLMDDPFAYWDTTRIERCLPIIERGARDAQAILFTANRELAETAERRGAHRVDLPEPALI